MICARLIAKSCLVSLWRHVFIDPKLSRTLCIMLSQCNCMHSCTHLWCVILDYTSDYTYLVSRRESYFWYVSSLFCRVVNACFWYSFLTFNMINLNFFFLKQSSYSYWAKYLIYYYYCSNLFFCMYIYSFYVYWYLRTWKCLLTKSKWLK